MSVIRRAWLVPLAVAAALTLLPTPLTGDYPPPPDPPPPDNQDPGYGGGAPGGGCGYYPERHTYCPSGTALIYRCYNPYVWIFITCL